MYVEFPASSLRDADSVKTWNSRKLKGKPLPGTWDKETVYLSNLGNKALSRDCVFCIIYVVQGQSS